ncbi:winged helix-turn-helix transcriptional regulator [Terriglobus saanensis]|nr:helix-turn-helix domain-containing protein [Terriglobus saanensis]
MEVRTNLLGTHKKVSAKSKPSRFPGDGVCALEVEAALRSLEGRWKVVILSRLFAVPVWRFSELERAIPAVSQKVLVQQLRALEDDGLVYRTVYPQVPPKVEYGLTNYGQSLCPALAALLDWAALKPAR